MRHASRAVVSLLLAMTAARAAGARAQSRTVLFFAPETLEAETAASLQDAVATQLPLVGAELTWITLRPEQAAATLEDRIALAKQRAGELGALGVIWLDARPTDHFFVYAMDARAERIVVRPISVRPEALAAAIETVAQIARGAAEALIRGEPIRGEPAEVRRAVPPPPPAAAPAERPPPRESSGDLRLALGYAGGTFSKEVRFEHGLGFAAGWLSRGGVFAGAGYTWLAPAEPPGDAGVSVSRHPCAVYAGLRTRLGSALSLDAELSAAVDFVSRRTNPKVLTLRPTGDTTRLVLFATPSVRARFPIAAWLGLYASAGLDVLMNNFKYIKSETEPDTVLTPDRARLRLAAGVEILR